MVSNQGSFTTCPLFHFCRYIEVFHSSAKEYYSVFVEGWYPAGPPPRRQGPPGSGPWGDGYGPRPPLLPNYPGMNQNYPPGPPGPNFYGNRWGSPAPPPRNPYDFRPPAPGPDPFYNDYWSRDQYDAPGPMRAHGPPPSRPSPYKRPDAGPYDAYYGGPPPPRGAPSDMGSRIPPQPSFQPSPSIGSNNFVFVRGLPWNVREIDIDQFFHVKPTLVRIITDDFGRPSEAKVEFATHEDAVKAMEKDKDMLCKLKSLVCLFSLA